MQMMVPGGRLLSRFKWGLWVFSLRKCSIMFILLKSDILEMKGFRHKSAEKKEPVNWTKYVVVTACVLLAVFMVFSMLGMSWLNIFSQAKTR